MRIGGYTTGRVIGRGGAGTVYEAVDDHGAPVAIKILTGDDPDGFEREVRLHAGLDHPGVVRVLGHGRAEGTPWVAMERIDGGSLADRLAARSLARSGTFDLDAPETSGEDEAELLGVVLDLCPALAWLHGEGLVHADLKPANVLLRGGTEPVIADLGLTRAVSARSRVEDRVRGSLGYVSPEQARGEPLDARADLFSLGAILFEVLTGVPPTDPANPREALRRLGEPAEPPSSRVQGIDPRLDALVLGLLDRDRTRRPPGATWVGHVLGEVLGRSSTSLRRVRPALFVSPLIGRQAELDRALADTHRALGQGGLVVIRGASGLGVTRLASEVTTVIRAEGVAVAGARGRRGGNPLQTVRRLSERLAAVARVQDPVRAWREAPAPTADLAGLGQQLARQWIEAARRRPVLLVIDDLDQVGAESAEVLAHALGELFLHPARAAVLATAAEGRGNPQAEALLGSVTAVRLRPLPPEELLRAAAGTLGVDRLPEALEHVLPERTAGSPLLAREWVTTAVAEGAIRPGDGGWAPATDPGTPGTLAALIDTRLDHLDAAQIEVIAAAGRLGDQLTEDRLARLDDVGGLRAALAFHLMERDLDGPRLIHPEVEARAISRIAPERAALLHRALAARFGAEVPAALVAGWHEAAGDVAEAARCWTRVAEEDERHHPTVALWARLRASELTGEPSSWWEAGRIAMSLGDREVTARAGAALAGRPGWEAHTATLRAADHRDAGRMAEAVDEALEAVRLAATPELRRHAVHIHLTCLRKLGATPIVLRAAFADDVDDSTVASTLAWHEGRWDDAATWFEREIAAALTNSDTIGAVRAMGNVAAALHRAGRSEEAHEATVRPLLLARRAGLRESEGHVWLTLALGYQLHAQEELALRCAGAALAVAISLRRPDLARRAVMLFVETASDDRAWQAAELTQRWGETDDRPWVAARLGREQPAETSAAPCLRVAATTTDVTELDRALTGQRAVVIVKALDLWTHRTGRDRERAIAAWRALEGTPGAGIALARLGVRPTRSLPAPPVSLLGAMPEEPGALLAVAARRFSGS